VKSLQWLPISPSFLGGAIGLSLLFGMPLMAAWWSLQSSPTAFCCFEARGFRTMELIIGSLVSIIGLSFIIEIFIAPIAWGDAAYGMVTPQLADINALTIAVGIIGATVMPHAIYLHSGLTQDRVVIPDQPRAARSCAFPISKSCWRLRLQEWSTWQWS